MKYKIITHGCQMNFHDSEKIDWIMLQQGHVECDDIDEADILIINTCSVRESAEDKVYGLLGNLKKTKHSRPDFILCVCGCMMQRDDSRNFVLEKFPHVDIMFGTNNIHMLPAMIKQRAKTDKRVVDILETNDFKDDSLLTKRDKSFKSYVNIMYGCDNFCTYCIVPYTRGREISRDPKDIMNEIIRLSCEGCKEITLLGQNVNSYGKSLETEFDFTDLLYKISEIDKVERIRFMTSHPKDVPDKLLNAYKKIPQLCTTLHLPVQSGSDRILKQMNRGYNTQHYMSIIKKVREIVPDITITTDIIVGFPGETESEFEETLELVKNVEFDSAFTFIYSKRSGTKAALMPDQIDDTVKKMRYQKLLDVVYEISLKKNRAMIGKVENVLFEEVSKTDKSMISGRTPGGKLVHSEGDFSLIGMTKPCLIKDANTFSLFGNILR